MIDRENISLNFIKKEKLTGSQNGTRYMFCKEDDKLMAYVWPEPLCFNMTDDAKKIHEEFELNNEGKEKAIEWVEEQIEKNISKL